MSAAPQPFTRSANYTNFETTNPNTPKSGPSLDAEFNNLKTTTDQLISRLAEIQRADGAPANGIVSFDTLTAELQNLIGSGGGGGSGGTAGVITFKGRFGDVVPEAGDYNAGQIEITPVENIAATDMQTALEQIGALITAISGGETPGVLTFNGRSGAVVAEAGDYSGALVAFTPAAGLLSTDLQAVAEEIAGILSAQGATITAQGLLIAGKADAVHTHTAAQISDSTAPGRALLTAADVATQFNTIKQAATTGASGVVQFGTQAQQDAFTAGVVPTMNLLSTHSARGLQSKWIPAREFSPNITNGPQRLFNEFATNRAISEDLAFDPTVRETARYSWTPPKQWDKGAITFQPYWFAPGGTIGQTARFDLAGVAVGDGEVIDGVLGAAVGTTDTLINNDVSRTHIAPASAAITISNAPATTKQIELAIARDVAVDTLTVDVRLRGIMIFYNTNTGRDN